jgi:hypothetical protein
MSASVEERYAVYVLGGDRCVWCGRPITFSEMELDHLIPKSLSGDELSEVLGMHGLPSGYDLESIENLVPSCRKCNGGKGYRPPPATPIVTMMLESAAARAPEVRKRAEITISRRDLSVAIGKIEVAVKQNGKDPELQSMLRSFMARLSEADNRGGDPDQRITLDVHPALALLWDPDNRWKIIHETGRAAAVVSDGTRSGVIGTDISYQCVRCWSNGPWLGNRCQNCGNVQGPWD